MKILLAVGFTLITFSLTAQKVGLVLSGGGAKGLAHVGVLKALEENNIPIDYVVGTSMGGIVAGCYAAGLSPQQIENIMLSEDFIRWINGSPEDGYNYYYHKNDDSPGFIKLFLSLDSTFNIQWKSTIVNDVSLNFALAETMVQASAISKSNFDSLMIPLRVVAADIFTQTEVVLDSGSLSDALRATQTVPFFYSPIRVGGKYLFDGGVYNNFPVDVAIKEFHPDIIIGSNVSSKVFDDYPYDQDDRLISNSLLYMLLDKSDPASIPESGVYIQPNLRGYTSFDFSQAKSLIDSGYKQTLRQIEEIRSKITSRRSHADVSNIRNAFNSQNVPLKFESIKFQGFNSKQRRYIQRIFRFNPEKPATLSLSDIKKGYFRLVSEEYFNNVYPRIIYKPEKQDFDFEISRRPQRNFQVDFGGVIASRNISNIFLGLNLYRFNRKLTHAYAGFQTGGFYKSAVVKARLDLPMQKQFFLEPEFVFNNWDFLESQDLVVGQSKPTIVKRTDRRLGLNLGWPTGKRFRATLGGEVFNNVDRYSNNDVFVSTDTLDQLRLRGLSAGFNINANSLNRKQYASLGKAFNVGITYYNVREHHLPGTTSIQTQEATAYHQWFRLRASLEQYFDQGWYHPGYFASVVLSNQPTFRNYTGTLLNAPAFFPLQDSRTLVLQNFRAFNYAAVGVRNVFSIRNRLDLRLEGYLFKPIENLVADGNQETLLKSDLRTVYFAGTAGVVLHTLIGPISLSVNYYDDEENQLGVLLHVGFLLFNAHTLER